MEGNITGRSRFRTREPAIAALSVWMHLNSITDPTLKVRVVYFRCLPISALKKKNQSMHKPGTDAGHKCLRCFLIL